MGAKPRLRTNREDKTDKLSPAGKQTYSLGGVCLREDGTGKDSSVSIHSCAPETLELGALYKTAGDTYVTPYSNSAGFTALSVVCDSLEKISDDESALPKRPRLSDEK